MKSKKPKQEKLPKQAKLPEPTVGELATIAAMLTVAQVHATGEILDPSKAAEQAMRLWKAVALYLQVLKEQK